MSFAYTSVIKVDFNDDVDLFMITNRFNSFERKIILLKSNGWVGMKVTDYVRSPLMSFELVSFKKYSCRIMAVGALLVTRPFQFDF